jgi:hypothetical protein
MIRGIPMKTVAIVSQKGGSGKTTLAVNLAVCAHHRSKTALDIDIDIDMQASAHSWHQARTQARAEAEPQVLLTHHAALAKRPEGREGARRGSRADRHRSQDGGDHAKARRFDRAARSLVRRNEAARTCVSTACRV